MHDARDRNQGVWIEHSDRLFVAAFSSISSLSVMFSGYFRTANGEIIEYALTVSPTSDRVITSLTQHFGAGFLLSCVATLASGAPLHGQCYVRAQVQRSTGTPAVKLYDVLGGYLTAGSAPSFPYGIFEGPLEGQGVMRSITGTDPAAGAEVSETVPTGARWRLYVAQTGLVTDATVANRETHLVVDDGTTVLYRRPTALNQAATATHFVWWGQSDLASDSVQTTTVRTRPFPLLTLLAGWRIRTITVNIQAGDNYGAPQLLVEEWLEA